MLPLVTYGITEASTTLSPSSPCTPMVNGSTTDIASTPIRREQDGCRAVSASVATQSRISASVFTDEPGEISPGSSVKTDAEILDWVATDAETALHPSCSLRMGVDAMSVVDPLTMGVHGLEGLKVVDASVMPYVTNGNIYAPVMMLAEKAADLILGNPPLAPEPVEFYRHRPAGGDRFRVSGRRGGTGLGRQAGTGLGRRRRAGTGLGRRCRSPDAARPAGRRPVRAGVRRSPGGRGRGARWDAAWRVDGPGGRRAPGGRGGRRVPGAAGPAGGGRSSNVGLDGAGTARHPRDRHARRRPRDVRRAAVRDTGPRHRPGRGRVGPGRHACDLRPARCRRAAGRRRRPRRRAPRRAGGPRRN